MMTARGSAMERRKGLALGADGFIAKPFELKELRAEVRRLLARRRRGGRCLSGSACAFGSSCSSRRWRRGRLARWWLGLGAGYRRLGDPVGRTRLSCRPARSPALQRSGLSPGSGICSTNMSREPSTGWPVACAPRPMPRSRARLTAAAARYLGDLAPAAARGGRNGCARNPRRAGRGGRARDDAAGRREGAARDAVVGCAGRGAAVHRPTISWSSTTARRSSCWAPRPPPRPALTGGSSTICAPSRLRHAHDRLIAATDADAASDLMCATLDGARILSARMRLLPGRPRARRLCADPARCHRRSGRPCRARALLAEVFDRIRRPAANLRR